MNQPSMKALMLRAKQEKQQKLLAQQQQQQDGQLEQSSSTTTITPIASPSQPDTTTTTAPFQTTTTLPMRSPVTKLPTPVLPQSFVNRIDKVSLNEVDQYLSSTLPDLYHHVSNSMHGNYQNKLCNEDDYVYIQNFLTPIEELCILTIINSTPDHIWTKLNRRHLIMYGGLVQPHGLEPEVIPQWLEDLFDKIGAYGIVFHKHSQREGEGATSGSTVTTTSSSTATTSSPATPTTTSSPPDTTPQQQQQPPVRPNHVLLNYYAIGDQIMPHKDGPAYSPQAVIISLLSALTLSYWSNLRDAQTDGIVGAKLNVYVEPRSLFIMKNGCYNDLLHGIDGVCYDPILQSHVNNHTTINYKQQFIPFDEFCRYVEDLRGINGDGDWDVVRYTKMINQIKTQHVAQQATKNDQTKSENDQTGVDSPAINGFGSISQRCERLSLTIRRVDPILEAKKRE